MSSVPSSGKNAPKGVGLSLFPPQLLPLLLLGMLVWAVWEAWKTPEICNDFGRNYNRPQVLFGSGCAIAKPRGTETGVPGMGTP